MGSGKFINFATSVKKAMIKHGPEILTGVGIVGMTATTVLAVKATPKALEIIAIAEKDKGEKLTKVECVKETWKCYIPAAVTGVSSVACLIGASSVNARRNAALAAAYNISRTALSEYKDAVVETVGEKKEREVKDTLAKKKVEEDPVTSSEVINTETGNTLCYDMMFGRYFRSDRDRILRAMNKVNRDIVSYGYASLNDFYDEIDLNTVTIGNQIGWNFDDKEIEVEFSPQLADDQTPCLAISYNKPPHYDYDKF